MAPMMLTGALPASASICRSCMRTRPVREHFQKRWLGQKYLAKMGMAKQEWLVVADEIKKGKRKNLFDELDERGFIKDVVG